MHDAVMAEFGGSLAEENAKAEGSREEVEPGIPAVMMEDGIELDGFHPQTEDGELTDAIGESSSYLIGTT